jgi:hypothetical protein
LKSVFEKKNTTVAAPPLKRKKIYLKRIAAPAKPADSGWIKSSTTVKEDKPVAPPLPKKEPEQPKEQPKPIEQPKPVEQPKPTAFIKSSTGEIVSSKKQE